MSNWYLTTCRNKARKTSKNSKTRKNNRQNSENNIFYKKKRNLCPEVYSRPSVSQIWRIYLDLWGHDSKKNGFDLLLDLNYFKVTQLWCNSNSTCRATYWMYIPSFKLISQSMLKKNPENTDGRTDGRTLPRHNTSVFKRAYKNRWPCKLKYM